MVIMQLQDFFDYKNQLMKDLLTSESIVSLLTDEPVDDVMDLAYTSVFPCEYIPETVNDGRTYICFDVDIQRSINKTYLLPTLYVWVFTHRSRLRLPNGGGVRTDKLCSEICKVINGSRRYGLGELELNTVRRFAPMSDYQGKAMSFNAKEFNRLHSTNQDVPGNRKGN